MAHFEKTTTTKHSIFYHPVGEQVFIYPNTGEDIAKIIGNETSLAEIKEVILVEEDCFVCKSKRFVVFYNVKIIDSMYADAIGHEFRIDPITFSASKRQSVASYFGHWRLYNDEGITEPLKLVKKIKHPDFYGFEETNDLLHIVYPGAYQSIIINKSQIDEMVIEKINRNLTILTKIDYCTIKIDESGEKIKGYTFEFMDSSLNFTVAC